ncbi:MAG TPA: DUF4124 domain-containing protein [Myxococcota bacterium]|nr:DUF4124 domain-containing protein [Myxococcota bacterium]
MRWLLLIVALTVGTARSAYADDVLFYWVDKKGTVHATQNIDEVPEPYNAMYRARLKELEEEKKKQKPTVAPAVVQPAPQPPPQPSITDRELARQRAWRADIAKWRTELRVATEELNRIQTELDQAAVNPILRTTPQAQARIGPLEEQREKALKRVEIARKTLAEDLPARAKRESVPPRWFD